MTDQTDGEAADDVDGGDDQAGDGVATDEFGRAIHGAVKTAFLFQFAAAATGDLVVDEAGIHFGIDRHLLAGHRIEAEPSSNFGDSTGAFGDHHEIDDEQDREENQADHHVAAHQETAKGGDDMAGGERPFVAVAEDQPGGGDVERQAQQGGEQQELRKAGEIQRFFEEKCDHQHEDGGGD